MVTAMGGVVAIVQARMGSTRLPGKVLRPLAGQPMLARICERVAAARTVDRVVLATTTTPQDDALADWAAGAGITCVRGSETDVLGRYAQAARAVDAAVIVRITADDPFKDPEVLDRVVDLFRATGADFACNNDPPSFPEGLDIEVLSRAALEAADREATDAYDREHVTPFHYRHADRFRRANLAHDPDLSGWRWTVDTPADFALAEAVCQALDRPGRVFGMTEILAFLRAHPDIAALNRTAARSGLYTHIPPTGDANGGA